MLLTPDVLFDSYRDITPAFLRQREIGLLLTDLDYTLAPKAVRRPDDALRRWIAAMENAGITVMIVSNNRSGQRVTEFCADLGVGFQGHAGKPSPKGLWAAMERVGVSPAHTAMLGGQAADGYAGRPQGRRTGADGGAAGRPGGGVEPISAPAAAAV